MKRKRDSVNWPTNSQSVVVKKFWFSSVEFEVLMCGGICPKTRVFQGVSCVSAALQALGPGVSKKSLESVPGVFGMPF